MAGLMWKDFLLSRKVLRAYGIFVAVCLLLIWHGGLKASGLGMVLAVMLTILPLSVFQMDAQAGWETGALCLPDGRRRAVVARALYVLLLLGVSWAISAAAALLPALRGPDSLETVFRDMLGFYALALAVLDIMLPLCWRLGAERAQPFLYGLLAGPAVLLALLERAGLGLSLPAVAAVFALALAGMGASCLVSLRIAAKKDV